MAGTTVLQLSTHNCVVRYDIIHRVRQYNSRTSQHVDKNNNYKYANISGGVADVTKSAQETLDHNAHAFQTSSTHHYDIHTISLQEYTVYVNVAGPKW